MLKLYSTKSKHTMAHAGSQEDEPRMFREQLMVQVETFSMC